MDPCSTPYVILEGSEKQLSKFSLNNWFESYDLIQPETNRETNSSQYYIMVNRIKSLLVVSQYHAS